MKPFVEYVEGYTKGELNKSKLLKCMLLYEGLIPEKSKKTIIQEFHNQNYLRSSLIEKREKEINEEDESDEWSV